MRPAPRPEGPRLRGPHVERKGEPVHVSAAADPSPVLPGSASIAPAVRIPPILVAEDSASVRDLLEAALYHDGIANPVVACADGREALDYLEEAVAGREGRPPPVLVLVDVHMPRGSGMDVLRWVRSAPPPADRTPVVVITGSAQEVDIVEAQDLGADAFLFKPVAFEALKDVIAELPLRRVLLPEERSG